MMSASNSFDELIISHTGEAEILHHIKMINRSFMMQYGFS